MQRIIFVAVIAAAIIAVVVKRLPGTAEAATQTPQQREKTRDGRWSTRFRIFALVLILALGSGLIVAFAYGQLGSDAGATARQPQPAAITSPPNGQGDARDVRVGDASGRLILVADNVSLPPGSVPYFTGYFETPDCARLAVVSDQNLTMNVYLKVSADGAAETTRMESTGSALIDGRSVAYFDQAAGGLDATASYAAVEFENPQTDALTISKAWIWCEPKPSGQ
jgi:hypothetical protein